MSKIFQKAVEYSAHGYSVLPINSNDKKPILKSWKQYQLEIASEEIIDQWAEQYPRANIGIVTGKVSNITVVDIDVKDKDHITPLSSFPETYTVKTPSGGYHLYYQYDKDIKQTANTFPQFPHVDIRNDGGFVVAPPSEYTTGKYEVIKNIPPAPFPRTLFLSQTDQVASSTGLSKQKVAGILRSFPKMAEGSGRNNALTSVIGKILNVVQFQDHEAVALPIALAANTQFQTPLPESEVITIFKSIHNKESKKPLAEVEFLRNDKGIIANEENVYRTIKNDASLINKFRFNIFTGVIESSFDKKEFEALQRTDVIKVRLYLMRTYSHFTKIAHAAVEDAMMNTAMENHISPPVEYIKNLIWDQTPRLDTWLSSVYGVDQDKYHKAVGSNWIKGLVKRIIHPGCKFDYVLVLEGQQGIKKSTSLAILGGSWHVETVFTPDNKDFFMLFSGKAIVEFSEGETLSRTEAKRLKAIITMQNDKYRPPYERSAKEFPRQCVFAMTTNQEQYLKDETGNRRWLPVSCKKTADIEWLKNNREQLFAEAYHRVITLNETTWEFPEEETVRQQQLRQTTDPREDVIYEWYFEKLGNFERSQGITTRDAFVQAIHNGTTFGKDMNKLDEMAIAGIFANALGLVRKRVSEKNDRMTKWFATESTQKIAPDKITLITATQAMESLIEDTKKINKDDFK